MIYQSKENVAAIFQQQKVPIFLQQRARHRPAAIIEITEASAKAR
jgi:hypothetical protein